MLVLTRRTGETLIIADTVKVTVLRCGANRVRLGIEAPQDTSVRRPAAAAREAAREPGANLPRKG